MRDPYDVLGVYPEATDTEIKNAYRRLARQYHPDNYAGDPQKAAWAEEKMKEINEAYEAIEKLRKEPKQESGSDSAYQFPYIRQLIRNNRFGEAEKQLKAVPDPDRTAEWHFLMSVVLTRRGWVNDAMRELEIACRMDPANGEYQRAKEMFNRNAAGYGGAYYNTTPPRQQQGCTACDMCQGLICADCCCECMGSDLIRCC